MNCKQGDLARYVGRHKQHYGKIVLIVAPHPYAIGAWLHEPELPTDDGESANSVWDYAVRPIRDQDGEDEMLRIAGKPMGIKA